MKITLIQSDISWENPIENLANFEEKIAAVKNVGEIIVLPEMFNAGFSMAYSEPMKFLSHKWMKQIAMQYQCVVCGSLAIVENQNKYNRFMFVEPSGNTQFYDKKHLFALGNEAETFTPGKIKKLMVYKNWNILPLVCYDLRFPVWCRNNNAAYDLLIFVASWPKARINAWKSLLVARAIENQCYVVGVNRLGTDGNGLEYNGQSMLIDFEGNILADLDEKEATETITLDLEALQNYRQKLPFLKDSDEFKML